ncbi:dihydropteroate synthase [Pseudonocardia sp.]|uniref:dihydropteroate synthase n=1 Tax=Pseudonocardia sp. TaxID=60912 RepID=UPI003D100432
MGIVNVTPDSFSDGGDCVGVDRAVARGRLLAAEGADLVDVGGESTRPGAGRVPVEEELARVLPVVRELAAGGVGVSIDTSRAAVAAAAVATGAVVINDVTGGLGDPRMAALVADVDVPYVVTHSRGPSLDMDRRAVYCDVVEDVRRELRVRVEALTGAGVSPARLVLDPGLGFAKTAEHNWALLGGLDRLVDLGLPVLIGASRKRFLAAPGHPDAPVTSRDDATAVVSGLAAAAGAACVRVHDVRRSRDATRVARAWTQARRR